MAMNPHEKELLGELATAWQKLEALVLAILDRRGVQCPTSEVSEMAVDYINHPKVSKVEWPGTKGTPASAVRVIYHAYIILHVH